MSQSVDDFVLGCLRDNMTVAAYDAATGKTLMGICINVVSTQRDSAGGGHADASSAEQTPTSEDKKFEHIMAVLRRVNLSGGDIWNDMSTSRFFDIKILTTSKVNRKGGLGRELIKRSIDLGRVLGFKAVKTEATGKLSDRMFVRNSDLYCCFFQGFTHKKHSPGLDSRFVQSTNI